MLRLFMNQNLFYSFNMSENPNDNYKITGLKLKKEINTLSSLTISCLLFHPLVSSIHIKRTCFTLHNSNNGRCLFIGKVLSVKRNVLSQMAEIECENLLGCLRDEICIMGDDEQPEDVDLYNYRNLLDWSLIDGLNKTDETDGYFGLNVELSVPSINVNVATDNSLSKSAKTEDWVGSDCLSILYDSVLNYTGAIVDDYAMGTVSTNNGSIILSIVRYDVQYRVDLRDAVRDADGNLDRTHIDSTYASNKDFEFGNNINDVTEEPSQNDLISAIAPFGSYKVGTNEYKIRQGAYSGTSPYVFNSSSLSKYGKVAKKIDFGVVSKFNENYSSDPQPIAEQNLNTIAQSWVSEHIRPFCDKHTVTAIDKYYLGSSTRERPIDICDIVHIYVDNAYDVIDYCLSIDIDFFNHENDRYIIGPYIPDNILDYTAGTVIEYNDKKRKTKNKRKK